MLRIILYLVIAACVYVAAWKLPLSYKYEDFKDYLTLLTSASGMVFTIMGLWIAFLYPNAVSRIVNPGKVAAVDFTESLSEAKRLESIVGAVLASAMVVIAILLAALAKLLLYQTPLYADHRAHFKAGSLALAILITLVQMEAIVHVALSNIMFINDLHWKRQSRKADEQL